MTGEDHQGTGRKTPTLQVFGAESPVRSPKIEKDRMVSTVHLKKVIKVNCPELPLGLVIQFCLQCFSAPPDVVQASSDNSHKQ